MGGAIRGVALPGIGAATEKYEGQQNKCKEGQRRNPLGRRGELILVGGWCVGFLDTAGEIVFGEQILFVQAEVLGDGADESAGETAAGELVPLLVFNGIKESGTDAGAGGQLSESDFAHFALAFQMF